MLTQVNTFALQGIDAVSVEVDTAGARAEDGDRG
jgi:hypothetical protein